MATPFAPFFTGREEPHSTHGSRRISPASVDELPNMTLIYPKRLIFRRQIFTFTLSPISLNSFLTRSPGAGLDCQRLFETHAIGVESVSSTLLQAITVLRTWLTPKELASVSSDGRKGWLVTSHFYWLSRCLNQQQQHTHFFVLDPDIRKAALEKLLSGKSNQEVEQLIFVMSVGRQDNGIVYLGTDKMPGDHWSIAVVNIKTSVLSYCDTLGWPVPENFLASVVKYTNFFGLSLTCQLTVRMAHKPNLEQHLCTSHCTNYPLQTCSDVCGVIAVICIAIAALDKDLFEMLLTPVNKDFKLYLTDPTQYSSYLRHVLIYWLVKGHIDISRISLKPGFSPLASSIKQLPHLKRKLDSECNGDSPKHRVKSLPQQKSNVTINDYILEALATGISSESLVSEVVSLFAEKGEGKIDDVEKFLANLMFTSAVERSKDDVLSMKSYVKNFITFPQSNPIILFKNRGKEMQTLSNDDTLLAIQTSFQKEMMKMYGKTCICVDINKKSEGDKFFLVTILVSFEALYELPVAWLISSRCDTEVLSLFFKSLKISVGELHTRMFVGDLNFNTYKIWVQHFSKPDKKMFIPWEVLHILNKKIEFFIPGAKEQSQIRSVIHTMLTVTDHDAFKGYLQALLDILKPFGSFLSYFKAKFVSDNKDELWASCYRQIPGKHVPFLKPYSKVLKELGLYGAQNINRMDIFMHKLLQLIRFLENKFYILPNQMRLERAIREIERRHEQPMGNLDIFQSASGEEWHVRASSETDSFSIVDSGYTDCKCEMKCKRCKMCVHRYICSCTDYLLSASSCIHIHIVNTYRKMNSVIGDTITHNSHKPATADGKSNQDINKLQAEAQKELEQLSQAIPKIKDTKALENICQMIRDCVQH